MNPTIAGAVRRNIWLTFLLIDTLLLSGCFTKRVDPIAPQWDVGLTAPISVKSYTLEDLVRKDTTILRIDAGGQVVYHTVVQAGPTIVGNVFSLNPLNATARAQLGALSIGSVGPLAFPVVLPGAIAGQQLPPMSRVSLSPLTLTFSQFLELTVRSGSVTLTIKNNLPTTVTIDSTVTVRDGDGNIVALLPFSPNQVPAGGELASTADLSGKIIPSHLMVANMSVSEGGVANTPSGNLLVATLASSDIVASHAVLASIPRQILVDNSTYSTPLRDSARIREVGIRSGVFTVKAQSAVPMNMFLKTRFPQLITSSGQAFQDSFYLGALSSVQRQINLAGLRVRSTDGGFVNDLFGITTVNLYEGSAGQPVTVSETDSIHVQVSSTTITVDTIVGIVKPTIVPINQTIGLRLGEIAARFRGHLLIPAANLSLTPQTAIGFPIQLNLVLNANDALGRVVTLPVPVSKVSGALVPIEFAPSDVGNFLSQISGKLPDSLQLVGTVVLNPDYDTLAVGSVGSRSTFGGSVALSVPLTVSIAGGAFADTVAWGDTTGDGNSDYQSNADLFKNINSGRVHLDVENGLPMAAAFMITLLDRDHRVVMSLPQTVGDSVAVPAAAVVAGEVIASTESRRVIALTQSEVRMFERAKYVRYGISLATPGTQPVSFRSNEFIKMRLWSEFSYQVQP